MRTLLGAPVWVLLVASCDILDRRSPIPTRDAGLPDAAVFPPPPDADLPDASFAWDSGAEPGPPESPLDPTLVETGVTLDVREHRFDAGGFGACAIRADGGLSCRGSARVGVPDGTFRYVSVGGHHACAIGSEHGQLRCWGDGDAIHTDCDDLTLECTPRPEPEGEFVEVHSLPTAVCALRRNGLVKCWGDESYFEEAYPDGLYQTISVTGWFNDSCGITVDGEFRCWDMHADAESLFQADLSASGDYDQIALSDVNVCVHAVDRWICTSRANHAETRPVTVNAWLKLSIEQNGLCHLDETGEIGCQLTLFDPTPLFAAVPSGPFIDVALGVGFVCGLRASGEIACRGPGPSGAAPQSGAEQCDPGSTRISGLAGLPDAMPFSNFSSQLSHLAEDAWWFVDRVGDPDQRGAMLFSAQGMRPDEWTGRWFDSLQLATTYLEVPSETGEGATRAFCALETAVAGEGQEMRYQASELRTFGNCPGQPVSGSLDIDLSCAPLGGPMCDDTVGSIAGTQVYTPAQMGEVSGDTASIAHRDLYVSLHYLEDGTIDHGLIFSDPSGPFAGEVFCVGEDSRVEASGSYALRNLSSLGRCEDLAAGDSPLSGCARTFDALAQ